MILIRVVPERKEMLNTVQWTRKIFCTATMICLWTVFIGCESNKSATEATGAVAASKPHSEKIAILFRKADDPYTSAIRDGMTVASEDFELQIEWMLTAAEDAKQQLEFLQKAVNEQVRAICISPADVDAVVTPLKSAAEAGIPVVVVEKAMLDGVSAVSFVSTDHFHTGRLLAQRLAKEFPDGAKVLLVNGAADANSSNRVSGLQYTVKKDKTDKLELIEANCSDSISAGVEQALEDQKDLAAIVAFNVESSTAVATTMQQQQREGIEFYAYGAWVGLTAAIKDHSVTATVLEDPYVIGYSALMAISKHLEGSESLEFIMPEAQVVTADNIDDDETKRLIESNLRTQP